jgi:hypothetical protein
MTDIINEVGETLRASLKITKYLADELNKGTILLLRDKVTKEESEVIIR